MIHAAHSHGRVSKREKEYLEGWQRAQADLANFRQRVRDEQAASSQRARQQAIAAFLPIADNFRAIVQHVPEALKTDAWVQGVTHVARQFEHVLAEQGVTVIDQTDVPFDPRRHEAVGEVADAARPAHHVREIVQPGYQLGEIILKAAKVKVST